MATATSIRTTTGKYVDLLCPYVEEIDIIDIANSLGNLCRYGGHVKEFYSVAEHSLNAQWVAECVLGYDVETQFAALMHDAAEAYIGDLVRPLKRVCQGLENIEHRIEQAIGQRFNFICGTSVQRVRVIDNSLLYAERRHLFGDDGVKWDGEEEILHLSSLRILHQSPCQATQEFLHTFAKLQFERLKK